MGNSSGWFCDWRIGYGKPYEHLVCGRIADCAACSSHRSESGGADHRVSAGFIVYACSDKALGE